MSDAATHPTRAQTEQLVPTRIPERIQTILISAKAAEAAATGPQQRIAWRASRELIAATVELGYPTALIAECLGVTTRTIRDRIGAGGFLDESTTLTSTGIPAKTVHRWLEAGLLPATKRNNQGETYFSGVDILRAVGSQKHTE